MKKSHPYSIRSICQATLILGLSWLAMISCGTDSGPFDDHPFEGGNGTSEIPFQIATIDQLQAIDDTLYLNKYFIQVKDIDASASAEFNNGEALQDGFNPIGDEDYPFTGSYNGAGYLIDNLYLKFTRSYDYNGLFGYVKNGRLENISVDNNEQFTQKMTTSEITIESGQWQEFSYLPNQSLDEPIEGGLGGLVGVNDGGVIRNCHFRGGVSGYMGQGGGGLVGVNAGLIEISSFEGSVSFSGSAGFVGWNIGEIQRSHVSGRVDGMSAYGFVSTNDGTIFESYADVDVVGTFTVSGFAAHNRGGRIESSFATGSLIGRASVAGLVATNTGLIKDSYSKMFIEARSLEDFELTQRIGGLIAENEPDGRIETSYSAGGITLEYSGYSFLTGSVVAENNGEILRVFWDMESIDLEQDVGKGSGGGATGLTTSQMTGPAAEQNMPEFDWVNIWRITEDGYPVLRWEER